MIKAAFFIFGAIHGGDENNRNVPGGRVAAQLGEDIKTVHFRHHHIQQYEVRLRIAVCNLQGAPT